MKINAKSRLKAAPMFINVPIMPSGRKPDDEQYRKNLNEAGQRLRRAMEIDPMCRDESGIRKKMIDLSDDFKVKLSDLEEIRRSMT